MPSWFIAISTDQNQNVSGMISSSSRLSSSMLYSSQEYSTGAQLLYLIWMHNVL